MDIIRHNLKFLVERLDRYDRLSIAHPCNKESYDQYVFMEIDRFVKDSKAIIHSIKHPNSRSRDSAYSSNRL
jgi:iron uptake system EfeUOB component EfeO/EfeM